MHCNVVMDWTLRICFPYSLPLKCFERNLTYSDLVFESGNLCLVMLLPLARDIKPRIFKVIICAFSHPLDSGAYDLGSVNFPELLGGSNR